MTKKARKFKGYDIIGDVHGHAWALECLLEKLGYEEDFAWHHPERQAIFVGDIIDRGPEQERACYIVKDMVEEGAAQCVMGNHEYNALLYAYGLRPLKGENDPHRSFLEQIPEDGWIYRDLLSWFRTLPLWLEFDDFAVIHACFKPGAMDALRFLLKKNHAFSRIDFIELSARGRQADRGTIAHNAYDAIEDLIKGPEIALPKGCTFKDNGGIERNHMRTRWWDKEAKTYRDLAFEPDKSLFPDTPLPGGLSFTEPKKFVFIGHYWLDAAQGFKPLSDKIVCTDYSVAKGGPLAAYRYTVGDRCLSPDNFVAVEPFEISDGETAVTHYV